MRRKIERKVTNESSHKFTCEMKRNKCPDAQANSVRNEPDRSQTLRHDTGDVRVSVKSYLEDNLEPRRRIGFLMALLTRSMILVLFAFLLLLLSQ